MTATPVALFDPCVLCVSHDFDWPVFEPGELQPVLHHLLAQMVTRLDGRCAHHVEIVLHGRSTRNRSASRILKKEVDAKAHAKILEDLVTQLQA